MGGAIALEEEIIRRMGGKMVETKVEETGSVDGDQAGFGKSCCWSRMNRWY